MGHRKRYIIPNVPHHITQRGSRRGQVFFKAKHAKRYLHLLHTYTSEYNVQVLNYCLMKNHVHLNLVPPDTTSLSKALQQVHRIHSAEINQEMNWTGSLWQKQFHSSPLDADYFWTAVKYLERNPVRAEIAKHPAEYKWSSAALHCRGARNKVLNYSEIWEAEFKRIANWYEFLAVEPEKTAVEILRDNSRKYLPSGSEEFVRKVRAGKWRKD